MLLADMKAEAFSRWSIVNSSQFDYDKMAFKFEKLQVWQKAILLSKAVNQVLQRFPIEEKKYVLSQQIKRAADSVALNIAEGSTGQSNKEFARFITIANRSAIEVVCAIYLAKSREIISKEDFDLIYTDATEIIKMLQAFKNTLLKSD